MSDAARPGEHPPNEHAAGAGRAAPLDYRRAAASPPVVAAVARLLAARWDPAGAIREAAGGDARYHAEQAEAVLRLVAGGAPETAVQGYLRGQEQAALGRTVHPFAARRAIAVSVWRAARGIAEGGTRA